MHPVLRVRARRGGVVNGFVPWLPVDSAPAGQRLAVKDVIDVAGMPTGAGHPKWLTTRELPARDPVAVARLRSAFTVIGKTHADELAHSRTGWATADRRRAAHVSRASLRCSRLERAGRRDRRATAGTLPAGGSRSGRISAGHCRIAGLIAGVSCRAAYFGRGRLRGPVGRTSWMDLPHLALLLIAGFGAGYATPLPEAAVCSHFPHCSPRDCRGSPPR